MANELKTIEEIAKGALGGAIDGALSSTPGLAIVWSAIKGGANAVRKKRAEVFLNFAVNHINIEMFNSEQFIDGLSITFEEYLKQRSEEKRKYIQNIFLGFVENEFDNEFEIERMYDLLNKLSTVHLEVFFSIQSVGQKGLLIASDKAVNGGNDLVELNDNYEKIKYLEYLGLVKIDILREMEEEPEYEGDPDDYHATGKSLFNLRQTETAYLSDFGKEFITYLSKE